MSQLVLDVLIAVASMLLAVSAIVAVYRIVRGPSILDRMIGTDVVLAAIMCGLGGYMALSHRTDLLPVLIVLAMLGFVGSVSVSRYVSKSDSMTPGAEVGALSDFSSSDWHIPDESADHAGSDGGTATDTAGAQKEGSAAGYDDVARGIADVPDGPEAVTVRDEQPQAEGAESDVDVAAGAAVSGSQGAGADGVSRSEPESDEEPFDSHADAGGEGQGTGPDAGPADADDGGFEADADPDEASRGEADADGCPDTADDEGDRNDS